MCLGADINIIGEIGIKLDGLNRHVVLILIKNFPGKASILAEISSIFLCHNIEPARVGWIDSNSGNCTIRQSQWGPGTSFISKKAAARTSKANSRAGR